MHAPRKLLAAALCLCLLAGCGGSGGESRSILMAAPPGSTTRLEDASAPAEAALLPEDPAADWQAATRNLASVYAGTQDGCYTLLNHADGSADVVFFDYAAATLSVPERPGPRPEGVTGSLPDIYGGATPVWAGSLFLFKQRYADGLANGMGEAARAAVLRVNTQDSGYETAIFPANLSFRQSGTVLADGGAHLYFIMEDNAVADGVQDVLVELDCATLEYTELYRFDLGWEHTIEGYWEKGPLILAATALPATDDPAFNEVWNNRAYLLYKHGVYSGSREVVMSWSQGLPNDVEGDVLYYFEPADGTLYALNANTGEARALAAGLAPQDYIVAQIQPMLDGLVRLQFSTNQGRTIYNYTIDPATGDVAQPPTDNLGDNVGILAEAPTFFLVRHSDKWVRRELVDTAGSIAGTVGATSGDFVSMPLYGLLSKADYWAGRPQYTAIADLIYGD